jgi:hypothetical protein
MSALRCGGVPAEPWHAGDGLQRPLRSRFPPRLMPSVRGHRSTPPEEWTCREHR